MRLPFVFVEEAFSSLPLPLGGYTQDVPDIAIASQQYLTLTFPGRRKSILLPFILLSFVLLALAPGPEQSFSTPKIPQLSGPVSTDAHDC